MARRSGGKGLLRLNIPSFRSFNPAPVGALFIVATSLAVLGPALSSTWTTVAPGIDQIEASPVPVAIASRGPRSR